jgi:hypothetical protein
MADVDVTFEGEIQALLAATKEGEATVISSMRRLEDGVSRVTEGMVDDITLAADAWKTVFSVGVAAAAGVVAAFAKGVHSFVQTGDKLQEMSIKTGLSVEALSTLARQAGQTNTDLDALKLGLNVMNRVLGQVDAGGKAAIATIQSMGITAKELEGKTPEEKLERFAQAIAGIEDPTKRSAAALKIFGRQGTDLIPFLLEVSGGLEEAKNKTRELGQEMDARGAAGADALGDSFDELWATVGGLFTNLGRLVAGPLNAVIIMATEFVGVVSRMTQSIAKAVEVISDWTLGWFDSRFAIDSAAEATDKHGKATENLNKSLEEQKKKVDAAAKAEKELLRIQNERDKVVSSLADKAREQEINLDPNRTDQQKERAQVFLKRELQETQLRNEGKLGAEVKIFLDKLQELDLAAIEAKYTKQKQEEAEKLAKKEAEEVEKKHKEQLKLAEEFEKNRISVQMGLDKELKAAQLESMEEGLEKQKALVDEEHRLRVQAIVNDPRLDEADKQIAIEKADAIRKQKLTNEEITDLENQKKGRKEKKAEESTAGKFVGLDELFKRITESAAGGTPEERTARNTERAAIAAEKTAKLLEDKRATVAVIAP